MSSSGSVCSSTSRLLLLFLLFSHCFHSCYSCHSWLKFSKMVPGPAHELSLEHGGRDGQVGFEEEMMRIGILAVGQVDHGEVGGLAGLEAPRGRLGTERPGTEERPHRQQERSVERVVATMKKSH